ncbi:sigma-70 factor [Catenovulum agarivorans DS-2]|uniref:Sigma-70 factor n=1 Tax=Catenovulum agarivorans DS-2 TaxID=1328313 RepID=W7Q850_9ALTE|nr:biopolymer transporter ExbD [Catenovulum agarivorans]EWH08151.1 sigma-70 factor [Catenovulum agarivorans DS-2]
MRVSAKVRRQIKHRKRNAAGAKLNLVSLMDIFTILVFFLMVNQSEVRVLQNNKELTLPASVAESLPKENITITVQANKILVHERLVWQGRDKQAALTELDKIKQSIEQELKFHLDKKLQNGSIKAPESGWPVTILGDATTEYALLKEVMAICAEVGYRDLSLAVEQKSKPVQAS